MKKAKKLLCALLIVLTAVTMLSGQISGSGTGCQNRDS